MRQKRKSYRNKQRRKHKKKKRKIMNIDTTSQQYQQYRNVLTNLRTLMAPRFVMFKKLPRAKQKLWLQRDPLLRKILKLGLIVGEWAEHFKEDIAND